MNINPTKTVNELITALPYIIDTENKKKIFHSWRVAIITVLAAKRKVPQDKLRLIFYAALLHDIGGVGFPIHIIHYLKRTDKTSRNILLSHPIIGAQLVYNIPRLTPVSKLILDHHEWINGMGYPRAKLKKDIPYGSQIIRIADSIDINIQIGKIKNLKELRKVMSGNIDKEYSKENFNKVFTVLNKKGFFNKLCQEKRVPEIFDEIQKNVGSVYIPRKIDAVGKTLEAIAQIIDMKHPFTSGHSLRVSRYAMAIALAMRLSHDEVTSIRWAGLLHDIGKLNIRRKLLDKPTNLTAGEYKQIQLHALHTYKIMSLISTLKDITLVAAAHHERFDGTGYPFGLRGAQIPLGARILSICDAFDAMTSNRPYRAPLTFEGACHEIENQAGKQFDPEIVKEALPLLRHLGF